MGGNIYKKAKKGAANAKTFAMPLAEAFFWLFQHGASRLSFTRRLSAQRLLRRDGREAPFGSLLLHRRHPLTGLTRLPSIGGGRLLLFGENAQNVDQIFHANDLYPLRYMQRAP